MMHDEGSCTRVRRHASETNALRAAADHSIEALRQGGVGSLQRGVEGAGTRGQSRNVLPANSFSPPPLPARRL